MEQELYRYKVLVVDDEPMAVRAICAVIERSCPSFRVAGTASNGAEALERIRETDPDLVLTDIAMPVLSGLDLAGKARLEKPNLCFVVISGYQDYEYMREAIRNGVLDYMAKPIVPSAIIAMMERVREQLKLRFFQYRNELLRSVCSGQEPGPEDQARYFPWSGYYAALIRENGLPRRFSRNPEPEIFGNVDEEYCVYGRDGMEELFLIPAPLLGNQSPERMMKRLRLRRLDQDAYRTLLYYSKPFPPSSLKERIERLYHSLNALSTVGLNQSIDLDQHPSLETTKTQKSGTEELAGLLEEIRHYSKSGRTDKVEALISQAIDEWGEQHRTQVWMEHAARRILNTIRQENTDGSSLLESEVQLEDAFYDSPDIPVLRENLQSIFCRFREEQKEKPKVDSAAYFSEIETYLKDHLEEPLSLQSLSDHFAISQTYMSKLFRKYADRSFSQYLTQLRMEQARQIMMENPTLYIKDIAARTGYQDQFYFSRIFRSYMGVSPAEFLKNCGTT